MSIDLFLNRVEQSTKAKSKELRLSLSEAQIIALEISQLLVNQNKLLEQINELQKQKNNNITIDDLKNAIIEITGQNPSFDSGVFLDGGSF